MNPLSTTYISPYFAQQTILLSSDEEAYLKELNDRYRPHNVIKNIASHWLSRPLIEIRQRQSLLLKIVRYSQLSEKHQIAASNAISILKVMGFSFQGVSLQGVRIPHADLSRSILDHADFTNANLKGVNLTACSLVRTKFDGAELDQVNLGIDVPLKHEFKIVRMLLLPEREHIVSLDWVNFYIWDLKTNSLLRKRPLPEQCVATSRECYLAISSNNKYIIRAFAQEEKGFLETIDYESLEIHRTEFSASARRFHLFAALPNDRYLMAYHDYVDKRDKIEIWQLTLDPSKVPSFQRTLQTEVVGATSNYCYHAERNLLAFSLYLDRKSFIIFYSATSLELAHQYAIPTDDEFAQSSFVMEFSPSGSALFIAQGKYMYIWDIQRMNKTLLFSEEDVAASERTIPLSIKALKLLPNTSLIAYFTAWGNAGKYCIRDLNRQNAMVAQVDYRGEFYSLPNEINMTLSGSTIIQPEEKVIVKVPLETVSVQDKEPVLVSVIDVRFTDDCEQTLIINREAGLFQYRSLTGKLSGQVRALTEHPTRERPLFMPEWPRGQERYREHDLQYACSLSPDSRYLIGEYRSSGIGHIRITEVSTGRIYRTIDKSYNSFSLSRDSKYLVFTHLCEVELWDIEAERSLGSVVAPIRNTGWDDIVLSPTVFPIAHAVIGQDGYARICKIHWEHPLGMKEIAYFEYSLFRSFEDCVKFASNELLFYLNRNGEIFEYNLKKKKLTTLPKPLDFPSLYTCLDVSQDIALLIAGNVSRIVLWDIKQKKWLDATYTTSPRTRISSNGRFAASWQGGKILVWEILEGKFHLLWQKPQMLEMAQPSLMNAKNIPPLLLLPPSSFS